MTARAGSVRLSAGSTQCNNSFDTHTESVLEWIAARTSGAKFIGGKDIIGKSSVRRIRIAESVFLDVIDVSGCAASAEGIEPRIRAVHAERLHSLPGTETSWALGIHPEGFVTLAVAETLPVTTAPVSGTSFSAAFERSSVGKTLRDRLAGLQSGRLLSNQLADEFITVLDSGDFAHLLKFCSDRLAWGAPVSAKTVGIDEISKAVIFHEVAGSVDSIAVLDTSLELDSIPGMRKAHEISRLFYEDLRVHGSRVTLALVFGRKNALLVSPVRGRDVKVPLLKNRVKETGWVRNTIASLAAPMLPVDKRRDEVDLDAVFASKELDSNFHELCADFRLCLLRELLDHKPKLIEGVLSKLDDEGHKSARGTDIARKLAHDVALQGRFLAVADSLVLRTIIHRFIEVFHGVPIHPRHDELLERHTRKGNYASHEVGHLSKGKQARFRDARELVPGSDEAFRMDFLDLDQKYRKRYGGDIHLSQLASAVQFLEEEIGVTYLAELLDLTNQARYSFRYDDLRPDALENFYERSLETAIGFQLKNGKIQVTADQSSNTRKDLGAYFTPSVAAQFTVEHSLGKLLQGRADDVSRCLKKKDFSGAASAIQKFLSTKICDPTLGGGSFLKEAFRQFTRPVWFDSLSSWVSELNKEALETLRAEFPWFGRRMKLAHFEDHVLTQCLYGVDYDLKALCIGSQTLTLEALHYMEGEEKFPSFINVNLKCGNAFVSPTFGDTWKSCETRSVQQLLAVRAKIKRSSRSENLSALFEQERQLVHAILKDLVADAQEKWGFAPAELSAFSWQVEFAEVFFNADGTPKADPGFDCIVGNPPWEILKGYEEDFFISIDPEWPLGKNAKAAQTVRKGKLLRDPEIKRQHEDYLRMKRLYEGVLGDETGYLLLDPVFENVGGGNGDPNTYKLACELYPSILSTLGAFGFLVPEGFAGDKGTRDLRAKYIDEKWLRYVVAFSKTNEIFPDATQNFCILIGSKVEASHKVSYLNNLVTRSDLQALDIKNAPSVSIELLARPALETRPLFPVASETEAKILEKFLRIPSPVENEQPWKVLPYTELHTTNDFAPKSEISGVDVKSSYRAVKGEHMDRYRSPEGTPYGVRKDVLYRDKRWASRVEEERVAWRKIAGTNDPRRMVASLLPERFVCFDSLNVITGPKAHAERLFLVAVLNSFCYEYFIRLQSKNNNVNIYFVALSPLPRLEKSDPDFKAISDLSGQLHRKGGKDVKAEAELEARIAHVYGLNHVELQTIVDRFDKVPLAYRQEVLEAFTSMRPAKRKVA